jgi:hypothetical protein
MLLILKGEIRSKLQIVSGKMEKYNVPALPAIANMLQTNSIQHEQQVLLF